MTEPMIEATEIVKILGEGAGRVQALKGITLSLAGGELTLLMGPSGSGKTTLLSVLGCMLSPTNGTVQIRGRLTAGLDSEELAELRRDNVGFVFQSYHLFPTLTAAENVRLALDVRRERSPLARAKADKALATVGLSGHRQRPLAGCVKAETAYRGACIFPLDKIRSPNTPAAR
jgi:putative ABC transport system ATP-binding protein